MLSDYDIQFVLKELPKIELSYEKIVHKKVHNADFIFAIPEGITCFIWFTIFKNKQFCFIFELDIIIIIIIFILLNLYY